MARTFVLSAFAAGFLAITGSNFAVAEEPKATETVSISSSVPDVEKLQAFSGVGVILGQKEWEQLAAAWGIKDVAKVDFNKEILLVGTWRGTSFKFLGDVKDGDLTVELVGDKDAQPGFRYKIMTLSRNGITKFQGKELPAATGAEVQPIKEKPTVDLSGDFGDPKLRTIVPTNRVITSQKEWDELVKAWDLKNAPKVDFSKEILVVGTSRSASFTLTPTVTNGDLVITAKGTDELAPGFRWRARTIPREGLKTIEGKEVPKIAPVPMPVTNPPVVTPPAPIPSVTVPPMVSPSGTSPSVTIPSVTTQPEKNVLVTTLPATNLPVTNYPVTNYPVTNNPITNYPITNYPAFNLPVTNRVVSNVPVVNLPVTNLPVTNWPVTNRPVTNRPVTNYPAFNRPVMNLPVVNLPVTNLPK
jgi:hypothetical protein